MIFGTNIICNSCYLATVQYIGVFPKRPIHSSPIQKLIARPIILMEIGTLNKCIKAVKVAIPLYVVAVPLFVGLPVILKFVIRMYMGGYYSSCSTPAIDEGRRGWVPEGLLRRCTRYNGYTRSNKDVLVQRSIFTVCR